jgi:hypothetical protein
LFLSVWLLAQSLQPALICLCHAAAESVNNKIQIKNEAGNRSRPAPFGQAPLLNLPDAIPASGNQQPNRQDSPRKRI